MSRLVPASGSCTLGPLNFSKSTRYALYAILEMAQVDDLISASSVAKQYKIPEGALAKVFQALVRAGLARGTRGVGGGYCLAKAASEITVLDVISVFEPPRPMGSCLLSDDPKGHCHAENDCKLRGLFDEVDEVARSTFASVTIETLAR